MNRIWSVFGLGGKRGVAGARDYGLFSGERQTGDVLGKIRADHKYRYQLAIDRIITGGRSGGMFGLDIFCGTGYGSYMLAESLKSQVLGVEGSAEAVGFANEHYRGSNTFYCHKEFPFGLPYQVFDFITCFESIEHVEQDEILLAQCAQSLKPGGVLFVSIPNEAVAPLRNNPNKFHYRHYRHEEMSEKLKSLALNVLNWYGQSAHEFRDGIRGSRLSEEDMKPRSHSLGEFIIYECTK